MKKRIAICGCTGHVVKFGHLVNANPDGEIIAVWDFDEKTGREVADELKCPFAADFSGMLEEYRPDGILVLTENRFKCELIIAAAEKGVNIFVEKPVCVNLDEAYRIRKAVYENNVRFFMTDPFVRKGTIGIAELIREGKLGKINEATIRICQQRSFEEMTDSYLDNHQGGIMAGIGGHALHVAHYLFGKPQKISAVLTYADERLKAHGYESNAAVTLLYPGDLIVNLQCSLVSNGLESTVSVSGTRGTARVVRNSHREGDESVEIIRSRQKPEVIADPAPAPLRHIDYFIKMLVEQLPNDIIGKDPLSNSGVSIDSAIEYVEIINSIYRCANSGVIDVL